MSSEALANREAIRALVTRFILATDRGRFADVAACFAVDGTVRWHTGGGDGRAAIEANLKTATANPAIRFVRHHLTTIEIALAPDMRTARGHISFFTMSNAGPDHAGAYVDRYVREDDAWLIAAREVRLDWQAPRSMYPPSVPP